MDGRAEDPSSQSFEHIRLKLHHEIPELKKLYIHFSHGWHTIRDGAIFIDRCKRIAIAPLKKRNRFRTRPFRRGFTSRSQPRVSFATTSVTLIAPKTTDWQTKLFSTHYRIAPASPKSVCLQCFPGCRALFLEIRTFAHSFPTLHSPVWMLNGEKTSWGNRSRHKRTKL